VKDNVRIAAVDAGARFAAAMTKPTFVTAVLMAPESNPAEAIVPTVSVCTIIPVALPEFPTPIVNPERVIVKRVSAAIPMTAVVMTMEVAPGAAEVAVIVPAEAVPAALAAGVADVAKKPEG